MQHYILWHFISAVESCTTLHLVWISNSANFCTFGTSYFECTLALFCPFMLNLWLNTFGIIFWICLAYNTEYFWHGTLNTFDILLLHFCAHFRLLYERILLEYYSEYVWRTILNTFRMVLWIRLACCCIFVPISVYPMSEYFWHTIVDTLCILFWIRLAYYSEYFFLVLWILMAYCCCISVPISVYPMSEYF